MVDVARCLTPAVVAVALACSGCTRLGFDDGVRVGAGDASADTTNDGVTGEAVSSPDAPPSSGAWPAFVGAATRDIDDRLGHAHNVRLTHDRDGNVWALWADDLSGNYEIYLAQLKASGAVGVGGSLEPGGISRTAGESRPGGVVFDRDNNPVVTWMEVGTTRGIWVRRYDRSNNRWQGIFGSDSGSGIASHTPWWPDIAIDASGAIFVAWEVYNAVPQVGVVHLKVFGDAGWKGIGDSASGDGISGAGASASLVKLVARDSAVHVAYRMQYEAAGNKQSAIRHLVYEGTNFAPLTADGVVSAAAAPQMDGPTLQLDRDGAPIIAFSYSSGASGANAVSYQLSVRRWSATAARWQEQASAPAGAGLTDGLSAPRHPALLIDINGALVVAFSATDGDPRDIFVRRESESGWVAAAGAGTAGNVSRTELRSDFPRLTAAGDGRIVVGWEQDLGGGNVGYHVAREP